MLFDCLARRAEAKAKALPLFKEFYINCLEFFEKKKIILSICLVTVSVMLQSAYYHSGGWRINPNLYEEGKVCLSLLNTWTGRGNEVWDPVSSSILQVLVSLQGLVLNSKPYFNEAGYDKQIGTAEGEKNSLSYNENTFLLNCKTMMYLMRKPPKVIY